MHRAHNGKPHLQRRDATGHLNPQYAADLRKRSLESGDRDDAVAFVERPRSRDALAAALGEEFIEAATAGADLRLTEIDEGVPEEQGGPFVITRGPQGVRPRPRRLEPAGIDARALPDGAGRRRGRRRDRRGRGLGARSRNVVDVDGDVDGDGE